MQSVASSVGDLKKILTNVKPRGIVGEVQLAAILKQILNSEQYDENVATVPGSSNRVEFAIRLPGDDDGPVYLPIDSKFPGDTYAALMDAYKLGDRSVIEKARSLLRATLRKEARDIRDKYIAPPHTTEFGVMFLPFEGLYAEAVNMGMIEFLQGEYKVTIAGPTTMAALLNSLQMGFNTLAVEKKSTEVWKILSEVKREFENYDAGLKTARMRIRQADDELDKLEGVRTRAINRKLRDVMILDDDAQETMIKELDRTGRQ
jgi:DNA recombination protein RmuC